MATPRTEQLALDLDLATTWRRAEPEKCTDCSRPALAKVYGFVWYQPRRAFVDASVRRRACSACLARATAEVTAEIRDQAKAYQIVWSRVPLTDEEFPGEAEGWAWWVVEEKSPQRGEGRKR